MATKTWVGTDSGNEGDWGTAANWLPSGVPVNSDDVILRDSAQSVTGSLNQSLVALSSLHVAPTYTGNIGSGGGALRIGATLMQFFSSGAEAFITAEASMTKVVAGPRLAGDNALQLGGTIGHLQINHGKVQIVTGANLDLSSDGKLFVQGQGDRQGGPHVVIPTGVTLRDVHLQSGTIINSSGVTELIVSQGLYQMLAGTLTYFDMAAGKFRFDAGTISDGDVRGGTFDASRTGTTRTITKLRGHNASTTLNFRNRTGASKPSTLELFNNPRLLVDDGQSITLN